MTLGVLSALPLISAANVCCCLWVVAGGVLAAYLLQQNEASPITPGDGALVGLLAGIIGAFVYLVLSIPINLIVGPMEREVLQRVFDNTEGVPPEFREYVTRYAFGVIAVIFDFVVRLFAGSIFSTLGGLVGAAIFRKPPQTAPGDAAIG